MDASGIGIKDVNMPIRRKATLTFGLKTNVTRDKIVYEQLTNSGIRVLIVWECSIRQMRKDPLNAINDFNKIKTFLESQQSFDEL